MRVVDGKLQIGNVKRNRATAKTPKPDRIACPLELPALVGAAGQALAQFESGLVKLRIEIVIAPDFKACGTPSGYILIASRIGQPSLKPTQECLLLTTSGHGYAYRGALAGIPLRQLAASMGHDVRTHMKHYGQWTDEAGLDATFGAANAKLTESLTKRQQQMQQ